MNMILGPLIGGSVGFFMSFLGRCSCNTCPITRNPWISSAIGALFGFLAVAVK